MLLNIFCLKCVNFVATCGRSVWLWIIFFYFHTSYYLVIAFIVLVCWWRQLNLSVCIFISFSWERLEIMAHSLKAKYQRNVTALRGCCHSCADACVSEHNMPWLYPGDQLMAQLLLIVWACAHMNTCVLWHHHSHEHNFKLLCAQIKWQKTLYAACWQAP